MNKGPIGILNTSAGVSCGAAGDRLHVARTVSRGAGYNQWQLESMKEIILNETLESLMGEKRELEAGRLGVGHLYLYPVTSL